MVRLFPSARNKVTRAAEHRAQLEAEVNAFRLSPAHKITTECNVEATQHVARIFFDPLPDLIRWGCLIGDCAHNLRSALDHAVYGLAQQESRQDVPPNDTDLMFPITKDLHGFKSFAGRRLKPLSGDDRKLLESLQPYHGPQQYETASLTALEELDVIDKHRYLPVSVLAFQARAQDPDPGFRSSGLPVLPPAVTGVGPSFTLVTTPLQQGGAWLYTTFPIPAPSFKVFSAPPLLVGFRQRGGGVITAVDLLNRLTRAVGLVLATLEAHEIE